MGGKQVARMVSWFEVVGESRAFAVCLRLTQGLEFFTPLKNQLVLVLGGWIWCGGCNWVRHVGAHWAARRKGSAIAQTRRLGETHYFKGWAVVIIHLGSFTVCRQ
jgi:hypothetical protein